MLIEAAAGLLDDDDPVTAIRREVAEELGVEVGPVTHVFTAYMSPGSVTEALAMVGDGRIVDGKTIMLLQWWALERR